MNICPYCQTSYNEILQTGFVGCQHCYQEIDPLKQTLESLYDGKTHRGKQVKNGDL